MATTTNFGWDTPDDTDLVKDGALAIRTLGSSIDTSFVDLKGGTTGQVLSKASNTDLDYTWVTTDDANAIQNAIVDAKGDLIAASAADTPARLAVGNNGETLVADSAESVGLRWSQNFAAGKNKIINGDFRINQRGFTSNTSGGDVYEFDRWQCTSASTGTVTRTAETFTPGTAPVAGYEAKNFYRYDVTGQSGAGARANATQLIESVRTFAGETITISFWAKAASGTPSIAVAIQQSFGTGGSPSASVTTAAGKEEITTSWARYSYTVAVPSISGKTIGTTNDGALGIQIWFSGGSTYDARTTSLGIQTNTFDIWGVQAEAGSVATAFQTATGTLQGELAACHRYYQLLASGNGKALGMANSYATTAFDAFIHLPVEMRTTPTLSVVSGTNYYQIYTTLGTTFNDFSLGGNTTARVVGLNKTGLSGLTAGQSGLVTTNNASSSVAVSAEL
jgi:hypothetical protein